MAKEPYFKFFYSDWLGSTRRAMMTLEQQGAYVNLMCHQFADPTCSLPNDPELLGRLSGLSSKWSSESNDLLRVCFPVHPTIASRVANPRMLAEWEKRQIYKANGSEGGKKSAEARQNEAKRQANAKANGKQTVNYPSPSPSPCPDACIDHIDLSSLSEDETALLLHKARELSETIGDKIDFSLPSDLRLVLKLCGLYIRGAYSENALMDAAEGVARCKTTKSAAGQLRTIVQANARKEGKDLKDTIDCCRVPKSLLEAYHDQQEGT